MSWNFQLGKCFRWNASTICGNCKTVQRSIDCTLGSMLPVHSQNTQQYSLDFWLSKFANNIVYINFLSHLKDNSTEFLIVNWKVLKPTHTIQKNNLKIIASPSMQTRKRIGIAFDDDGTSQMIIMERSDLLQWIWRSAERRKNKTTYWRNSYQSMTWK